MSAAHEPLVRLAEHQLALAEAGRWDELPAVMAEWEERSATLPAVAPAAARAALEHMAVLVERLQDRLRAGCADTARELAGLQRGRGAVRGYQAAALLPGSQLDGAA